MLAPLYCICSWLDIGIPLLLPLESHDTYWATYWRAKHDEMSKYSSRPCKARWTRGEPHQMRGKPPAPEDCTFCRAATWIGGY